MITTQAANGEALSNESWDVVLKLLQKNGHALGPILLDDHGRYCLIDLDGSLRRPPQVLWIALPYITPERPKPM